MTPSAQAISRERLFKLIFFLLSLVVILSLLLLVHNMLIIYILALVAHSLLAPVVDSLERKGYSRLWSTSLPFIFITVFIAVVIGFLIPNFLEQIQSLQENFHLYSEAFNRAISMAEGKVQFFLKNVYLNKMTASMSMGSKIQEGVTHWFAQFFSEFPLIISQSITIFMLVPFFAFFMLLDGRQFIRNLLSIVPNNYFELVLNLNYQISTQIGGFIQARILESIIVGLIIWLGLLLIGFPYSLLLATIAAILNVIPYIGPLIGFIPALVIHFSNTSLVNSNSSILIGLVIIYFMAQLIDTVLLVPFLVAKIVNLHPVTVVLAILAGAQFFGILGMIICIPIVSALKVSAIAIYNHTTHFRT